LKGSVENTQWCTYGTMRELTLTHTTDPIRPMSWGPDPNQPARQAINDNN